MVEGVIKSGQKWSDPDFPANQSSLTKGMDTQDYKK